MFTAITLTGTVELSPGVPAGLAVVRALLSAPITDTQTEITPTWVQATADVNGAFSIVVPANDDETTQPTGTFYSFSIDYQGSTLDAWQSIVPHATTPKHLFSLARLPQS